MNPQEHRTLNSEHPMDGPSAFDVECSMFFRFRGSMRDLFVGEISSRPSPLGRRSSFVTFAGCSPSSDSIQRWYSLRWLNKMCTGFSIADFQLNQLEN